MPQRSTRVCCSPALIAAVATVFCALFAHPARAQTPASAPQSRPWTVEFHVASLGAQAAGGQAPAITPSMGASFVTEAGLPSRVTSSWYLGDGAALFNQTIAQFNLVSFDTFEGLTSLDAMLYKPNAARPGGAGFGIRVGRRLTPKLEVEATLDRHRGRLELTKGAKAAVEDVRESFRIAFSGLLASAPTTGLAVTSAALFRDVSGSQTSFTAAMKLSLVARGRLTIFATAGAGVVSYGGEAESVTLRGNYAFRLFNLYPINETDVVSIRFTDRGTSLAGLIGGGLTWDVSPRHGVRAEARLSIASGAGTTTSVEAAPSVQAGTPAWVLPTNTSPGIQFSTTPGIRSSLSGNPMAFETFTSSGIATRSHVSIGYFLKF